MFFITYKLYRW